jgi:hypothetical protein
MPKAHAGKGAVLSLLAVLGWATVIAGQAASSQQDQPTYTLKLAVDEVSLTLQVLDDEGRAVDDLKIEDLRLLDNGVRVRRMIALDSVKDAPVRVGVLVDSSESMESNRERSQSAAIAVVRGLMRRPADRGFAMDFAGFSPVAQEWTGDERMLEGAIRNHRVAYEAGGSLRGTVLFDSLYRACLNEFAHSESPISRNVIVLFSDGVDNSSRADMNLAVDECQRQILRYTHFDLTRQRRCQRGLPRSPRWRRRRAGGCFMVMTAIRGLPTMCASLRPTCAANIA